MLSACASSPVELPDWNLTRASETAQQPVRLPEFPAGTRSTDSVTYTTEEFRSIVAYLTASGGNYDIALANAEALERQAAAYNYLIEAGRLQAQFAQIREEQLARERREHAQDNWFHRGLIALGLAAVAF